MLLSAALRWVVLPSSRSGFTGSNSAVVPLPSTGPCSSALSPGSLSKLLMKSSTCLMLRYMSLPLSIADSCASAAVPAAATAFWQALNRPRSTGTPSMLPLGSGTGSFGVHSRLACMAQAMQEVYSRQGESLSGVYLYAALKVVATARSRAHVPFFMCAVQHALSRKQHCSPA